MNRLCVLLLSVFLWISLYSKYLISFSLFITKLQYFHRKMATLSNIFKKLANLEISQGQCPATIVSLMYYIALCIITLYLSWPIFKTVSLFSRMFFWKILPLCMVSIQEWFMIKSGLLCCAYGICILPNGRDSLHFTQ